MRIKSGSCSSSSSEAIHGVVFCSEMEKMLLRMVAAPTSHGSMRIVKEPGNRPGDDIGAIGGLKVSKKLVSPFSDLQVRLIAARYGSCRRRGCQEASGLKTGGAACYAEHMSVDVGTGQ
jgi:hypothetical protein